MIIHLHGTLKERFGSQFEIQARTVSEAIEGLSRQLPEWPRDLLIDVPGFETETQLRENTDAKEIHLVPSMFGGGGKFGAIILGAALIVAAVAIPGIGAALKTALIINGAITMAMGVIGLFMKAPSISKSNDPAASKYLGVDKNTAEIGTLIPSAWGEIKLYGHWVSLQSDADKLVHGVFPTTPT